MKNPTLSLGIIGLGHWGPNIVRNFCSHPKVQVNYVCDLLESSFLKIEPFLNPDCKKTTDPYQLINATDLDAVVIVTPATVHYDLVKAALKARKHIFCEKPLTLTPREDMEIHELAKASGVKLVVGYTFLFNNGVLKIKKLMEENCLGNIYYLTTTRTHMGLIREDVGVVWDLAPHDVSIMNFLLDSTPERVSAVGAKPLGTSRLDTAFINLYYPSGIIGQIQVSWVDSNKERMVRIIGSKARVTFDDLNGLEPVRLYEKGIGHRGQIKPDFAEFKLLLRDGDILSPKIEMEEPLKKIVDFFIRVVLENVENICDGHFSARVSGTLAAAHKSIENCGAPQPVQIK